MLTELEKLEDEYKYVRFTLQEVKINIEIATKRKQIKVLKKWETKKSEVEDMLSNVLILLMREDQHAAGAKV